MKKNTKNNKTKRLFALFFFLEKRCQDSPLGSGKGDKNGDHQEEEKKEEEKKERKKITICCFGDVWEEKNDKKFEKKKKKKKKFQKISKNLLSSFSFFLSFFQLR